MKTKFFLLIMSALMIFSFSAKAQADLQVYYDFGKDRQYVSTTFELFKADKYGDTFVLVDHYFTKKSDRDLGLSSAANGTYFELERAINFWQDSKLKNLSAYLEYDGSSWGASIFGVGARYSFNNADFSNTFSLALIYDVHIGVGSAKVPLKLTGVWGMQDIFGLKGLRFSGFMDIWGNDSPFGKFSVLAEPQIWYCLDGEHINVGTELELSYNFAGRDGFMFNPCLGIKWVF